MATVNQADYLTFLRNVAGVPVSALPDASTYITTTYNLALALVSLDLNCINTDVYCLAVYNCATDRLIGMAPDQTGQTFFADARNGYGLNSFVAGVVSASGDESTNQSLAVPDALSNLTLMDMGMIKTPFGRAYLEFAQMLGTNWGLS